MGKKKPRLDYDKIARALGAERVCRVPDPLMAAVRRGRSIMRELLRLSGAPMTAAKAARYLGVRAVDVRRMRDGHGLLSLGVDPLEVYPAWQFRGGGTLPGLRRVLRSLAMGGHDEWSSLAFLVGNRKDLGGQSPLDRMMAGGWRAVLDMARAAEPDGAER
jgi:hypothetical protein